MIIWILLPCGFVLLLTLVSYSTWVYTAIGQLYVLTRKSKSQALAKPDKEVIQPIACFSHKGVPMKKSPAAQFINSPTSHSTFSLNSDNIVQPRSGSYAGLSPTMMNSWVKSTLEMGYNETTAQHKDNFLDKGKNEKLVQHYLSLYYERKAELGHPSVEHSKKKMSQARLSYSCIDPLEQRTVSSGGEDTAFVDEAAIPPRGDLGNTLKVKTVEKYEPVPPTNQQYFIHNASSLFERDRSPIKSGNGDESHNRSLKHFLSSSRRNNSRNKYRRLSDCSPMPR